MKELKEPQPAVVPDIIADPCFLETQFPVSKMSKESYTERKAVAGQTLTGLGKWWGRKPLVLCRATILGALLPATENPEKDREVFLRLMTMDEDGLLQRKSKTIPPKELFIRLAPSERNRYFEPGSTIEKPQLKRISKDQKLELQKRVFLSLSYDERLDYCARPEQIDGPSVESWKVINRHLGTDASTLAELVVALGKKRFGRIPRVGDAFCGGGSIPFEAARLGCESYGSDLNPAAALLSWAALNIIGAGKEVSEEVQKVQREAFESVDRQITEWGIEHREPDQKSKRRWRADAYLYCTETKCPECGWQIPLAPSWVIAEKTNVIARLTPDAHAKRFDFQIIEGVTDGESEMAENGTVRDSELVCPNSECKKRTPIKAIRGDGRGDFGDSKSLLRGWEINDVVPRADDIFGERLYCVRWIDTWKETDQSGEARLCFKRHYLAPTAADFKREQKVLDLLLERFSDWQAKGFIPSRRIESGVKTDEPIRTRGWTHWHHLFNPRQLLELGLLNEFAVICSGHEGVGLLLFVGRLANWNSKLCRWQTGQGGGIGGGKDTFSNQALNTLLNYSVRGVLGIRSARVDIDHEDFLPGVVVVADARSIDQGCDIWITDPPYADAICYEEISEFFLAWYDKRLRRLFPAWYSDSRRALAVKGEGESFVRAMVDCYKNLAVHMSESGIHIVMFTHQNAAVWADLTLILWAAGLKVTAAWCIATETGPATGEGNYVQGTVILVLRKQGTKESAFMDEVYQDVETEVRQQLDKMRDLDDAKDPNFGDTDYQLAAYAAALRVLTSKQIEDIDINYELAKSRNQGETSPVEKLIERAVTIACDHLVPRGIDTHLWKSLGPLERFYLKGVELESHGEKRNGVYQELARGFGVADYRVLLASTKANETRLKTASEFGRREMGETGFGPTLARHVLFAAFKTAETDSTKEAITWLTTEVKDYASCRSRIIDILEFLGAMRQNASLPHWKRDADAAAILAGALRNRLDNV